VDGGVSRGDGAAVAIRPAEPGDVDALLALEDAAFETDRIERRSFRRAVRSPTITLLIAWTAGEAVGYAMILRRRGSATACLGSIAVAPAAAGMGLGKRLLAACEAEAAAQGAARLRLAVRADNAVAQHLYETMGYRRIGHVDDYYEDGAAAWRYEKALAAAPDRCGTAQRRPRRIKGRRARSDRHRAADR
jgi:ribosomal protein S18 acetylase RimI-like enzyme